MTDFVDKAKQALIVTGIVGGSLGAILTTQDSDIKPSEINRSEIVNIEPSSVNRSDMTNIETAELSRADIAKDEKLPEEEMEIEKIETTKESLKIIIAEDVVEETPKPKKVYVVDKVKTFFKPRQFNDTEDPEPYDVYMKNNWDGNFLRSEGVNARFGKYKKTKR